jgi:hypothetical protein
VKPTFDAQGQAVLNLEFCLTVCKKSKGFRRSRPDLTFCKSPYRAFLGLSPARSLSAAFERRLERSCQRPVCSTCNIHFLLLAYGTSVPPSRVHRTGRNQGVVGHRRRCRQQGSGCSGRTGCPSGLSFIVMGASSRALPELIVCYGMLAPALPTTA